MKKKMIYLQPLATLFILLTFSLPLYSQNTVSVCKPGEILQSPYHDAIQLKLASLGINVIFENYKGYTKADIVVYDLYTGLKRDVFKNDKSADSMVQVWIQKSYDPERSKAIVRRILARNMGVQETDLAKIKDFNNSYFSYSTLEKSIDSLSKQTFMAKDIKSYGVTSISYLGAGGPNIAAVFADGLAQFAIDRIKEDFNTTVLTRLKKLMESTPEFQKLFPSTWEQMKDLNDFSYSYYLNNLKPAFEKDIRSMLGNISSLSEIDKYQEILKTNPDLCMLFTAFDLVYGLQTEEPVQNTIQKIYSSAYIQKTTELNATGLIRMIGFLSYALRDIRIIDDDQEKPGKGWITFRQLNEMFNDPLLTDIYLGLIYTLAPDIQFSVPAPDGKKSLVSFRSLLDKTVFKDYLMQMVQSTDRMKTYMDKLTIMISIEKADPTSKTDLTKYSYYLSLLKEWINMADQTFVFMADNQILPAGTGLAQMRAQVTQINGLYLPMVKNGLDIAQNIQEKQYNLAIFNVNKFLKEIDVSMKTTIVNLEKMEKDSKNAEEKALYRQKADKLSSLEKSLNRITSFYVNYGNMIAGIALAKNGQEVKDAIAAVALPTGSSRVKKESSWNFCVNGYAGAFFRNVDKKDTSIVRTGFTKTWGISVPFGLAVSKGFKKAGSLSLFTGILDVGQIFQYRIEHDTISKTTVALPDIVWADIISPSIQLVYGFPWYIPFSLGAGCQWLPIKLSGSSLAFKPYFNIMITYDIPVVNIWTQKRKK
jgi:hypothetical protein